MGDFFLLSLTSFFHFYKIYIFSIKHTVLPELRTSFHVVDRG